MIGVFGVVTSASIRGIAVGMNVGQRGRRGYFGSELV